MVRSGCDFNLPIGDFDKEGWSSLMRKHPETAFFISQAPGIEMFLKKKGISFPTEFAQFRRVILDYSLTCIGADGELKERITGRFNSPSDINPGRDNLSMGMILPFLVSRPDLKSAFSNLAFLGVFGECIPLKTETGEDFCPISVTKLEDNKYALAGEYVDGEWDYNKPEDERWEMSAFMVLFAGAEHSSIYDLVELLTHSNAVVGLTFAPVNASVDLSGFDDPYQTELCKQLALFMIAHEQHISSVFTEESLVKICGENYQKLENRELREKLKVHILKTTERTELPNCHIEAPLQVFGGISQFIVSRMPPFELSTDNIMPLVTQANRIVMEAIAVLESSGGRATDLGSALPKLSKLLSNSSLE